MTKTKTTPYDSADYLKTEADITAYLQACFEDAADDPAFIAKALGTVARARGMSQVAKETGIGRESLYKSLSGDSNPSFATVLKVINALDLKINIAPIAAKALRTRAQSQTA
jgi:probable addiction module antidote protein